MTKPKTFPPISEQIINAINASKLPRAEIARRSGVDPASLCRFVNSGGWLTRAKLDRLADVLRMKLARR